jgi:hypothetical protein
MRPIDLVIKGPYSGAVRDEAGVKENAGIVIRKILLLKALVDLLVQLMLVHGEKVGDNRWRVTVNGTRGGKVRGDSAGAT